MPVTRRLDLDDNESVWAVTARPVDPLPPLRGEVRCQRENARAGCIPITPIAISFTEPVAAEGAARVALVGPDGTRFPQQSAEDEIGRAHV